MNKTISFRELGEMTQEEFDTLIDSITDEQAVDSECGSDSDADDLLPAACPNNTSWEDDASDNSGDSCDIIPPSPNHRYRTVISESEDEVEDDKYCWKYNKSHDKL